MARRFDRFIASLSCVRVSDRACNQYSRIDGDLRGNAIRRRNLKRYLEEIDKIGPDTLLVGEAPSYRGGRLTGIAFVSERVMLDGISIASPPGHILGAQFGYRMEDRRSRLSGQTGVSVPHGQTGVSVPHGHAGVPGPQQPSTEASATMVWSTIRGIDPLPMLWNAFPFHPFDRGNPRTNRIPDAAELLIGQQFLAALTRLFDFRSIVAIGNQAALSLSRIEIVHEKVRHPSQGGKQKFVAGMARLTNRRDEGT